MKIVMIKSKKNVKRSIVIITIIVQIKREMTMKTVIEHYLQLIRSVFIVIFIVFKQKRNKFVCFLETYYEINILISYILYIN